MKKPKMILFDYGHTLLYEPCFNFLRGNKALFNYITKNKNNISVEDLTNFDSKLFQKISIVKQNGFELHEWQNLKFLYEYLGIEFSVSLGEAEKILWDNTAYGEIMPYADKMIDYINAAGIRSGVISNIGFSGAALTERINRLLPNNKFEFIIASSEYMFRKPSPYLFELALNKADLSADEVWFCGDNIKADVEGAANVGIFPVWYDELTVENPWVNQNENITPNFKHLHIHDWNEFIKYLDNCI